MRSELINMIWDWIKSSTISLLNERHSLLVNHLRLIDAHYLTDYYDSKEHQFIYAYTRLLSNLMIRTTQRTESSHSMIKDVINRHTLIQDEIRKIIKEVENMFIDRKTNVNNQRNKLSRLINRKFFDQIECLITHEAIDLLIREWNLIKKWALEMKKGNEQSLFEKDCLLNCDLFMQYNLPCKCWLYDSLDKEISIFISLIHSRWLLNESDYVIDWQMSLTSNILLEDLIFKVSFEGCSDVEISFDFRIVSDKYEHRDRTLMKSTIIQSIDLQKQILDACWDRKQRERDIKLVIERDKDDRDNQLID